MKCIFCGKETKNDKFCSRECANQSREKHKRKKVDITKTEFYKLYGVKPTAKMLKEFKRWRKNNCLTYVKKAIRTGSMWTIYRDNDNIKT